MQVGRDGARRSTLIPAFLGVLVTVALVAASPPTIRVADAQVLTPVPSPTATPLNHFMCYEIDRTPFAAIPGVSIVDQFGSSTATLRRRSRLCNPADKNGEDPTAPTDPDHLIQYDLRQAEKFSQRTVTVTNQFGSIRVRVVRPDGLLVPTAKSLAGDPGPITPSINHFKCYRVAGATFRQAGLAITDQFGRRSANILRPYRICNPASKNGEPILDPAAHLMCYRVRTTPLRPVVPGPIYINNQFGSTTIDLTRSRELCVPSSKTEQGAPTPTPTVAGATATATLTPLATDTVTPEPTLTPLATDTVTPEPTLTPLATETVTPEPTLTPLATDTVTPEPTLTAVATATATTTAEPTITATVTAVPTATQTVTPLATPTATVTGVATATRTATPTATLTALLTPTQTVTPLATPTATLTAVSTATRTATPTATLTALLTPTQTVTPLATPTATLTAVSTATRTATPTATLTALLTPTQTVTPLATPTATLTAVPTATRTATPTATLTALLTPTRTVTPLATPTATLTAVPTATRTATPTATLTAVVTATRTATPTATPTLTAVVTATRTATPTATLTAVLTATRTVTPVPTVTSTPGLCGNGIKDAGEDCDPVGAANTCFNASNTGAGFTCNATTCQCACPAFIEFVGTSGTLGVLDTGWTGQGHDATVVDEGKVTVAVTTCAGSSRPCGVCNLLGPVDNLAADAGDINSQRCTGNTRTKCNVNADCAVPGGTCEYFFGAPLPLAAGGVATCVTNQINGVITGTANVDNGSAATTAALISRVYSGPTSSGPCPKCVGDTTSNDNVRGGTCDSGQNPGQTCDINGTSPNLFWGSTSLDCPPLTGGILATLPIDLTNSTGTRTRTLSAASPNCRAIGFTASKCFCDTCNNLAATPCGGNADCPNSGRCVGGANAGKACLSASECPTGACNGRPCTLGTQCASGTCTAGFCSTLAGICGGITGQRCSGGTNNGAPCSLASQCVGGACNVPGTATAYNQCDDATCSPVSTCVGGANQNYNCTVASECPGGSCVLGNEGECAAGPFEQFCGPNATFQGCTASDPDCRPYNNCVAGANSGATCVDASECPGGACQSLVGGGPELCVIGKNRDCFTDNGVSGNSVNATGVADPPTNDESDPTLAALFCIGPTSSSAVNGAAGLPGLGRLELPGHSVGFP